MKLQWERWSPLAGVLAVAGMLIAFALISGAPGTNDSDAKITTYFTTQSHQTRSIVAFFVFLAGILFLLAFFSVLRTRLVAAEGEAAGRLGALAYGSGVASAVFWVAAMALFSGPALTADDTGRFHLDPNTFRLVSDTGYEFWVAAVVTGALVVWATSAVALRTGLLPRWFGWLGIIVGVIQLFAIVFFPVFVYWGWILLAALMLARRTTGARSPTAPT